MSTVPQMRTRKWLFVRYYEYKPKKAMKDYRRFELTLILEFPAEWDEDRVRTKEDNIIDVCNDVMENKLFLASGYDKDTWTEFYDGMLAGYDGWLTDERGRSGRWDRARGWEPAERGIREATSVICTEPYRGGSVVVPLGAWREIYDLIGANESPSKAFYKGIKDRYDIEANISRRILYIQRFNPENCRFITRDRIQAEWEVVDMAKHYFRGENFTRRGFTNWTIPTE